MNKSQELLSDIVVYNKYARYRSDLYRREGWNEIIDRYVAMMLKKYCGNEVSSQFKSKNVKTEKGSLAEQIIKNSQYLYDKKVLPSMRALQFSGPASEKNEARVYNCSYCPIDDYRSFSEIMFLLLGGTGCGYSVQFHHIDKLPEIRKPLKYKKFLVSDSIEGWSDAVKALVKSYFGVTPYKPRFDFSDIRDKGAPLITAGGKAPGPDPLKICLAKIEGLLNTKQDGDKLKPLEAHDIICFIADAVLAGGIRRAALISLFSMDDIEMATCKHGHWWETNPQRGRANNSAVIVRNRAKKEDFDHIWQMVKDSNSGEPGIYWTNDPEYGTNPCCFTGGTKVLTYDGYKTFSELDGDEDIEFINYKGDVVNGKVWKTGLKSTIRLSLSNGKTIKCTEDHRLMDVNGEEVQAKDTLNLRLMPHHSINREINNFVKYGFIQGDGSTGRLISNYHKGLEIYFGENDLDVANIFGIAEVGKAYVNGFNDVLLSIGMSSDTLPSRTFPSHFRYFHKDEKLMFLKGMYSANGCVIKNHRVSYKTTCRDLAEDLVKYIYELSDFEIRPYITTNKSKDVLFSNGNYTCKESYDVNISTLNGIIWFAEKIGFVQTYKQNSLSDLIKKKSPKVIKISSNGIDEVYDFFIDDEYHWGIVEGIVAHNCEISLRPFTFCNLTEVNAGEVYSQDDFDTFAKVASFFGTLQAGFTDFHYLRSIWIKNTEKDSLIGVGITGICNGTILPLDLTSVAHIVKEENRRVASIIGINSAARTTTIKPSGTTSCVVGTSSGIHAWHSPYYIRNMQCTVGDDLYNYFSQNHPSLIKIMDYDPKSAVIGVPQKAPDTAILRHDETALEFLERTKRFNLEWVKEGHVTGPNTNNVSATCNIKEDEWDSVGKWMWENRKHYNGLSVLPFDGGSYKDAPFTDCSEEVFIEKMKYIENNPIDLELIYESGDNTDLKGELACAGGSCEIVF
jgi:ribonucleotide reductase alpha subunit